MRKIIKSVVVWLASHELIKWYLASRLIQTLKLRGV